MDSNRYGGFAPGLGSNQSYFRVESLREHGAALHLPLLSSTRAPVPLTSGALPRQNFEPLGIHVVRTHLGDRSAILSPYGLREPMGRSVREPYGKPIRVGIRARAPRDDHGQNVVRGELTNRDVDWELLLRDPDQLSTHAPFFQHRSQPQRRQQPQRVLRSQPQKRQKRKQQQQVPWSQQQQRQQRQQIIATNSNWTASTTARRLSSPSDSDTEERNSSSSPSEEDSKSLPANSEPDQKLHVRAAKEVLPHELNEEKIQEMQPKVTEKSERDVAAKENDNEASDILDQPGWCSLCNVDCVTKEVLHKYHALGRKHMSMLKKLGEVSGDGKKPSQLKGWCSLCEVDCKTKESLYREHILTEEHQMRLGIQRKPQKEQHHEIQEIRSSFVKRKQKMEEGGSMPSPKRQKLSGLTLECKVCNKEFNSQVVLESHLSGKKHVAQLKKLGNSTTPLENTGESKICTDVVAQESDNSQLLILANDDAKVKGKDEETSLEAKDNREVGVKTEKANMKGSAETNEVDCKKDDTAG